METKQVMMHNVSSLPLSVILKATYPFQLLVEDPRWAPVNVKSSQSVKSSNFSFNIDWLHHRNWCHKTGSSCDSYGICQTYREVLSESPFSSCTPCVHQRSPCHTCKVLVFPWVETALIDVEKIVHVYCDWLELPKPDLRACVFTHFRARHRLVV